MELGAVRPPTFLGWNSGLKFLRFGLYRFQRFKIKFFMCCHIVWLAPFTIGRGRYSPAFVLKNACR